MCVWVFLSLSTATSCWLPAHIWLVWNTDYWYTLNSDDTKSHFSVFTFSFTFLFEMIMYEKKYFGPASILVIYILRHIACFTSFLETLAMICQCYFCLFCLYEVAKVTRNGILCQKQSPWMSDFHSVCLSHLDVQLVNIFPDRSSRCWNNLE